MPVEFAERKQWPSLTAAGHAPGDPTRTTTSPSAVALGSAFSFAGWVVAEAPPPSNA
jgi:hypothetical protein